MDKYAIPFNRPGLTGHEFDYMKQAIRNGHISGDGSFTKRCEDLLNGILQSRRVLLTTSCTHALEMCALLLDLREGDEVILPAFTFVSTCNAFVLRGAKPVFADIRSDTLNIDEDLAARLVSPRTRAIVVVHYAGVGCELESLTRLAKQTGIALIEDNAHGLLGKYHDRWLGTFGSLATQSFHETKNLYCGEGGALIINEDRFIARAEILREKGTNRSRFFRGQVDKYTWVDVGSSYVLSDLLAAFLLAQLESREQIQARREAAWKYYHQELSQWAPERGWQLPSVPTQCEQSYHMYYLILRSEAERQSLMDHLKSHGILSVFHYQPLHLSDMGRKFGGKPGDCPVTEGISGRLLRLPFYNELTQREQDHILQVLRAFAASPA